MKKAIFGKFIFIIIVVLLVSFTLSSVLLLLPTILITLIISTLLAYYISVRLSKSITVPLEEISKEILKIKEDNPEFDFSMYKYDELNQIPITIMDQSEEVRNILEKLNFEKLVRQEFFSNASHELKTPITSIKGYTELLDSGMFSDEEVKKDFHSRIKKETENMANLINDILMISKLETKEIEVDIEEVRIYPLILEVVKTFAPLARTLDVKIEIDCMPLIINVNPGQMKELIGNLLSNGIKYNLIGGTVTITVRNQYNSLMIKVADTGIGIHKDSINRIFERFYRVDKGRSKKIGGTGLGLSTVKHIVGYYNGNIQLESEIDVGTKIIVTMPVLKK
ncbi:MAG: GHKL domain-containing protein [Clostridiales bacterium]|nr:GHKL domain-containing protein [Clostridiales bacterium]